MLVDTVATLQNISELDRFNGLALIVQEKYAWYLFDSGSALSADGDLVIAPLVGSGRWIKLNNSSNVFNNFISVASSSPTTVIDNSNFDLIQLVLNSNTTINFATTLRNGITTLILNRNGGTWTISGWDSRFRWGNYSTYNFSSGDTVTSIELAIFSNLIYVVNITEY